MELPTNKIRDEFSETFIISESIPNRFDIGIDRNLSLNPTFSPWNHFNLTINFSIPNFSLLLMLFFNNISIPCSLKSSIDCIRICNYSPMFTATSRVQFQVIVTVNWNVSREESVEFGGKLGIRVWIEGERKRVEDDWCGCVVGDHGVCNNGVLRFFVVEKESVREVVRDR